VEIIPAIDIKDGKVVRLVGGDYNRIKTYSGNPAKTAQRWSKAGAHVLHVVDLDGAREGKPKNIDAVASIVASVDIPVQMGGGLRSEDTIEQTLAIGVTKVVLGTKAVQDIDFVARLVKKYGDKIIVSVDAKDSTVMIQGWTASSGLGVLDMAKRIEEIGVSCVVYTDVSADGTLCGPNYEGISRFLENVGLSVIVAGGISSLDDIKRLSALHRKNLIGIIVGKALYEETINLEEAILICSRKG